MMIIPGVCQCITACGVAEHERVGLRCSHTTRDRKETERTRRIEACGVDEHDESKTFGYEKDRKETEIREEGGETKASE
jgi:hypothetical protein